MALINNSIESLYNGVSEQAPEHRQKTQVKEMINAVPTIDKGLLKRNPTQQLTLSASISYDYDMFIYEYDRGLSGDSEEKYSISITNGGIEIINVLNGTVYKEGVGLTYSGNSKDYLYPFSGKNGYAATTIKDTTFIVNKAVTPRMTDIGVSVGTSITVYEAQLNLPTTQLYAPYVTVDGITADGYTTITVDGMDVFISSIHDGSLQPFYTFATNIVEALEKSLDSSVYSVDMTSDYKIHIKRLDNTAIVVTYNIVFKYKDGTTEPTGVKTDFITSITTSNYADKIVAGSSTFLKNGYIWIKISNSSAAYTYYATVKDNLGNTKSVSTTKTTTEAAATDLAALINADANFSATAVNSVVKVTASTGSELVLVEAGDSYGNQASYGWAHKVQYNSDLPKILGFEGAIVNVTGSGEGGNISYWLKYQNAQWVETIDPRVSVEINGDRMPHILVRNSDDSFTLKPYDGWTDRLVGDETNKIPSFIASTLNQNPTIRDIFFFKNRLGFITSRNVIMSSVDAYGNFWRTTMAAQLDSDPIDTSANTTKAIQLEFATYLENSIVLFSDKAQFKVSGGQILSPSSVEVSQISSYEIDKNIRPYYMNDKIFFCVKRGINTAVMQYQVKSSGMASEALDITAHVQTYIPSGITRMSGSPVNNMLFLVPKASNTIFVYKYYDSGEDRIQSAWFKWQFNGTVYNAFSLGKNLNIMINRLNAIAATDWIVGTGIWESDKLWDSSKVWISTPDDLTSQDQFEVMSIAPINHSLELFWDALGSDNETQINTEVTIGKWVPTFGDRADIRGHLKFKTVQISSEDGSDFQLVIYDKNRDTVRTIASKYTVNRKPMVYGDAKNIEIGIRNRSNIGFRINTVSYEGSFNSRSKKY